MAGSGIDFAVIMQNVDLFYFTGSIQKGTLVVPLEGEPIFFVQRSIERVKMEIASQAMPDKDGQGDGKGARATRSVQGHGRNGAGCRSRHGLSNGSRTSPASITYLDISGLIKELRIVKSPFELEQIKRSGAICDVVFAKAREVIREGVREIDIDAELVAEGRRHGHQGFLRMRGFNQEMMNLYVTSGYTGAIPSFDDVPVAGMGVTPAIAQGSSMKTVEKGIPVTVDYGGGYNGYMTDETRPFVVGELEEMFRKPYEVARSIVEEHSPFRKRRSGLYGNIREGTGKGQKGRPRRALYGVWGGAGLLYRPRPRSRDQRASRHHATTQKDPQRGDGIRLRAEIRISRKGRHRHRSRFHRPTGQTGAHLSNTYRYGRVIKIKASFHDRMGVCRGMRVTST